MGIPFKIEPLTLGAVGALAAARFHSDAALLVPLYGSTIAHELGHALTARTYGVESKQIILHGLGGMDVLAQDFKDLKPGQKIAVALAGPAVSISLGSLLVMTFGYSAFMARYLHQQSIDPLVFAGLFTGIINVVDGMANLLPIGPLDGGQALGFALENHFDKKTVDRIVLVVSALVGSAVASPLNPLRSKFVSGIVGFLVLLQLLKVLHGSFNVDKIPAVDYLKKLKEQGFQREEHVPESLAIALENGYIIGHSSPFKSQVVHILRNDETQTYLVFEENGKED